MIPCPPGARNKSGENGRNRHLAEPVGKTPILRNEANKLFVVSGNHIDTGRLFG
jgi:hypothetical protein